MSALLITFTLFIIIHVTKSLTIMDSQQWSNNITCYADDDCQIDCTNCRSRTIRCRAGYSCIINCAECLNTKIKAFNVVHLNINCSLCQSASIEATLLKSDGLFQLNCFQATNSTATYPGCQSLTAKISHIQTIYASALLPNNNIDTITINCIGAQVCRSIYIDSTINGRFKARCTGSNSCSYGDMVYNPPRNTGRMHLNCATQTASDAEACYNFHIMSLTARTIYVECGDGTQNKSQSTCWLLAVTGPVMPFNDSLTQSQYTMANINKNSVIVQCHSNQCKRIEIYVPFGEFQTTALNYIYDWNAGLYITYECGWDFPSGGWDEPQRNVLQCGNEASIQNLVLYFLAHGTGSNVVVTNNYMFDAGLLYNEYSCQSGKHCIIYSLERNGKVTHVNCPNDGVSYCYILAMQANGLSGAVIDGVATKLLLVKGYDKGLYAGGSLDGASIIAPDKDIVPGGILLLPAGNADNSWSDSRIYAENTAKIFVFKTNSAFVGAMWYVNNSEWTHIDCSYHSMCQDMDIYVEHDSFGIDSIIPDTLCVSFGSYAAGCNGATLHIKDTNTQNVYTLTNKWVNNSCFWVDSVSQKTLATPSSNGICADRSRQILNETWYWWYDATAALYADAPQCNWIRLNDEYMPPVANYCHVSAAVPGSFQQTCLNSQMQFKYYQSDVSCAGSFQLFTGDGVPNDCGVGVECGFATYSFKTYNKTLRCEESAFIGYRKGAVFLEQCINGGMYYECDVEANTLVLYKYNDTVNCSGEPYGIISYNVGDCIGDLSVVDIQCNPTITTTEMSMSPTSSPTHLPTTTDCVVGLFNVSIVIRMSSNTFVQVIVDTVYTETVLYLQQVGSAYLLSIFCKGSIFITFQQTETDNNNYNEVEIKLFIINNENSELEVDSIDDDAFGDILEDAITEQTGQDIEVDVDVEIHQEITVSANGNSPFLGLAEGVQYLLVAGLLFIIILLICSVTLCCILRWKNKNVSVDQNTVKAQHKSVPTASPVVDDGEVAGNTFNTFPFIGKSNTDFELSDVDLQKKRSNNYNPVMLKQKKVQMLNIAIPALPQLPPPIPPVHEADGPTNRFTGDNAFDDDFSQSE